MLLRMSEMVAPRALVFRPLVKGNEALGTRLGLGRFNRGLTLIGFKANGQKGLVILNKIVFYVEVYW